MLYQLSYASAAQTNELYQKGHENCKETLLVVSTSQAVAVENPASSSLFAMNYLSLYQQVTTFPQSAHKTIVPTQNLSQL